MKASLYLFYRAFIIRGTPGSLLEEGDTSTARIPCTSDLAVWRKGVLRLRISDRDAIRPEMFRSG